MDSNLQVTGRARMRQILPVAVGAFLIGVVAGGTALAAGPPLRLGDGLGTIRFYDVATATVVIGDTKVGLMPRAAEGLQRQLARQGWKAGQQFAARYNVIGDGAGGAVIESIHVFPPRLR